MAKKTKKARAVDDTTPTPEQLWNSSAPMPIDITTVEEDDALERVREAEKADVLYFWHALERQSENMGRASVKNAIHAQLLRVQGPPLPSEVDLVDVEDDDE